MATLLPFPRRPGIGISAEPTLRELLRSRGIEPTSDERRRKRREAAARKRQSAASASRGEGEKKA